MELWRAKALEQFPDFKELIAEQFGLMGLWLELYGELQVIYEKNPLNDDLISRIYDYARWCISQPQDHSVDAKDVEDPSSTAAVCLFESLPTNKKISEDLHRWISVDTFLGFESLFRYHLSDDEYRAFSEDFMRKKKQFSRPSSL